ncbi:hypothetical protein E0W68_07270 [Flavobacterium salilacus subsp. salilacus]|uniref:hypothetical protein n=1 Tax=Flavobacterium TaxID=237 RepID=UPI001074CA69|nr:MULTISPECIES: hypothetical protein [Flavobacterium]KAF2519050.1 hypothetical protein E0W68_07270 [Flavobacterium salilacus subsp. salilacus]MBE1614785.1 hypothetical protein [Flavobacterium sp. SaA2.13]
MEDENLSNNEANENTETSEKLNSFLESLKEIIKNVNINEAINSIVELMLEKSKVKEKIESEKINSQDKLHNMNLRYSRMKLWKEGLIILTILVTVILLSCFNKIDNCTLGTLLGSIIGYSIGNFNSSNISK